MFTSPGEKISVYVKTTDGLRQVWSSTRNDVKWAHQYVDLGRIDADEFSVIFHVRFGSLCRTSVGLDNIKFHPCTVGECVASMWLIQVRIDLTLNGKLHFNKSVKKRNLTCYHTHHILWTLVPQWVNP